MKESTFEVTGSLFGRFVKGIFDDGLISSSYFNNVLIKARASAVGESVEGVDLTNLDSISFCQVHVQSVGMELKAPQDRVRLSQGHI